MTCRRAGTWTGSRSLADDCLRGADQLLDRELGAPPRGGPVGRSSGAPLEVDPDDVAVRADHGGGPRPVRPGRAVVGVERRQPRQGRVDRGGRPASSGSPRQRPELAVEPGPVGGVADVVDGHRARSPPRSSGQRVGGRGRPDWSARRGVRVVLGAPPVSAANAVTTTQRRARRRRRPTTRDRVRRPSAVAARIASSRSPGSTSSATSCSRSRMLGRS